MAGRGVVFQNKNELPGDLPRDGGRKKIVYGHMGVVFFVVVASFRTRYESGIYIPYIYIDILAPRID